MQKKTSEILSHNLETNDIESIQICDESKFDDLEKNIIASVKKNGKISAELIYMEYGKETVLRYMQLCNQHSQKKISESMNEYIGENHE